MPKVCLLLRGLTVAQSFVCILIWVKLQVLDVLLKKKKKEKQLQSSKAFGMGFGGGVQIFKNIDLHFPIGHPGLGLVLTVVNEIQQIQIDLILCVFSLPIYSVFFFFFFFIIPSSHFPESIFYLLFSILLIHTYTHAHTYTHMGQPPPSTTCWFSISKGHSQPSLSPGSRWRCLALSLELAPPGHCSPCRLVHGPSFSSTFQSSNGRLKAGAPVLIITGRRPAGDSETTCPHGIVPGTWEEGR